ncbi:MAG: hypothetical protein WKG07_44560 [Hymenobacter sp.]
MLRLCEQLGACSDEEIQAHLHQLTFAQPEQLVQPVRLLLHSSQYIRQRQVASIPAASSPRQPPYSYSARGSERCWRY